MNQKNNTMKKINVVITAWKNGEIVNHIKQLPQKEFQKYNTGKHHVYELGGYEKKNGERVGEIPQFYWVMRPSIGTPQTYSYANDVMRAASITYMSFEGKN